MQTLSCPKGGIRKLTFSPDGNMLAGIGNKGLHCWNRNQEWVQSGIRHRGISHAVFHPNGRTLAYSAYPAYPSYVRERDPEAAAAEEFAGIRLHPLTSMSEFDPEILPSPPGEPAPRFNTVWTKGLVFTPDGRTLLTSTDEDRGIFSRSQTIIFHWHFTPSGDRWLVADATPGRTVAERGAALVGTACLALAGTGTRLPTRPRGNGTTLTPDVAPIDGRSPTGNWLPEQTTGGLRWHRKRSPSPPGRSCP